uniref:P-type domain-containing protein n=1 Tax=Denticeps clupeoides TaxID=299321 RepID=A0AAY4DHG2_9TELE
SPIKITCTVFKLSDQCQVNNFERVPCGEPGISASNCSAIRCCFDGHQCYYVPCDCMWDPCDGGHVILFPVCPVFPIFAL